MQFAYWLQTWNFQLIYCITAKHRQPSVPLHLLFPTGYHVPPRSRGDQNITTTTCHWPFGTTANGLMMQALGSGLCRRIVVTNGTFAALSAPTNVDSWRHSTVETATVARPSSAVPETSPVHLHHVRLLTGHVGQPFSNFLRQLARDHHFLPIYNFRIPMQWALYSFYVAN